MFCARLPSIFNTSHKMPRLPWNLHLVATWRSPDNTIRKKTRNTTRLKCCACHENCNASSENVAKDTLPNTSECHEVPRLPCETKQCHMWNLKWPLRLRTVANGCGRLRTVRRRRANTPSASRPPEWKREPLLRIREKHGKTQPAAQKSRTQQTEETHKNKIPIPALSTFLAPPATQLTYKAWQQSTCRAVQTPSRSITPLDAQTSGRPLPDPVEKTYWH